MTKVNQNIDLINSRFLNDLQNITGTYQILVSPSLAREWLDKNIRNRPINENHVLQLKRRMDNGEWVLNGQPIVFGSDGSLLNGQHRLNAVVKHGNGVLFDVRFGVKPSTFDTMDDMNARSASDVIALSGSKYHVALASAIKLYNAIIQGVGYVQLRSKMSNKEVLSWYMENKEIYQSAILGAKYYDWSGRILPASHITAFHFIFSKIDSRKADIFFEKLATGVGLEYGNPVLTLRNLLIRYANDKNAKMKNNAKLIYVIHTWNAFHEGRQIKKLVVRKNVLPEISGFKYNKS